MQAALNQYGNRIKVASFDHIASYPSGEPQSIATLAASRGHPLPLVPVLHSDPADQEAGGAVPQVPHLCDGRWCSRARVSQPTCFRLQCRFHSISMVLFVFRWVRRQIPIDLTDINADAYIANAQ